MNPEGRRTRQGKPWYLLLQNPSQSKPVVLSAWPANKQSGELSLHEKFIIVSGEQTFTYAYYLLSWWDLTDFLQFLKGAMLAAATGRNLLFIFSCIFNPSHSDPFNFHFSSEPQGYIMREPPLYTFARGVVNPLPPTCDPQTVWMFQALPGIARAVRSQLIIQVSENGNLDPGSSIGRGWNDQNLGAFWRLNSQDLSLDWLGVVERKGVVTKILVYVFMLTWATGRMELPPTNWSIT